MTQFKPPARREPRPLTPEEQKRVDRQKAKAKRKREKEEAERLDQKLGSLERKFQKPEKKRSEPLQSKDTNGWR